MSTPGYLRGLDERIRDEVHEAAEGASISGTALRFLEERPPATLTSEQAEALADLRQGYDRLHSALHRLQGLIR